MSAPLAKPSSPTPDSSGAAPPDVSRWARLLEAFPWAAWLASGLVHGGLLLFLSLLLIASPKDHLLFLTSDSDGPPLEEMNLQEVPFDDVPVPGVVGEASLGPIAAGDGIELPGDYTGVVGNVRTGPTNAGSISGDAPPTINPLVPASVLGGGDFGGSLEVLTNPLGTRGGGLEGRKFENRLEAALAGGGTRRSEAAVEHGLAWLAEHQFPDGGWRFDLTQHPRCNGECRDSGSYQSTTSATGLALLSFLGAGYTSKEGKYAEVVTRGLYYLGEHMNITEYGGDLRDNGLGPNGAGDLGLAGSMIGPRRRNDTMYSHGIATIALTEAYAMTRDKALKEQATSAIKFIINAQYEDGGWRYNPKWEGPADGDMTVTGWQMAALKSALLAGIDIPSDVWTRASKFIDGLQYEDGSKYSYLASGRGTAATTAVGLLCRMIGGWPRETRALQKGAARIGEETPQQNNMYFIYYASQVLHHLGGPRWDKWNPRVREYLIKSQATDGHETGSWYFQESHSTSGGRLYTTAMAVMTLEVYYRYMPLYGETFVGKAP